MIHFDFENNCCGCGVCFAVCPAHAIAMQQDTNGFPFPSVDAKKCVDCGKCELVCPHLNGTTKKNKSVDAWLYRSKDVSTLQRSSSGGAFFELAKRFMTEDHGVVCGCAWNADWHAEHIVVDQLDALHAIQGSKYVQSTSANAIQDVVSLLSSRKKVLFSGTPCQVTAVHNAVLTSFGESARDRLLTVGIICHGVSAPAVWTSFREYLETKMKSKLIDINFRDKTKKGYGVPYCKYMFADGRTTYLPTFLPSSKYIEATIVYNLAMRKCCTHCDCKGVNQACDILLGDWYTECKGEGRNGTSCICAFSNRGKNYVTKWLDRLQPIAFETIVKKNELIATSVKASNRRDAFLRELTPGIWKHVEKYYPRRYILKFILVKTGLYPLIKKIIG